MRPLNALTAGLLLLVCPLFGGLDLPAQVPVVPPTTVEEAPPIPAPAPAPATPPQSVLDDEGPELLAVDLQAHSQTTLEEVRKAIEKSDKLGGFQKRILLRRLSRPKVAERVVDAVTSQALDAGYIQIAHGGYDGDDPGPDDDVQILIDWEGLIGFIERLIPLIVKLIGLFG